MTKSNILYGKPGCVQCTQTERFLDRENIPYTKIDVTEDEAAYKYISETLGYSAVPVVETPDDHWYGLRPDKLALLKASVLN